MLPLPPQPDNRRLLLPVSLGSRAVAFKALYVLYRRKGKRNERQKEKKDLPKATYL